MNRDELARDAAAGAVRESIARYGGPPEETHILHGGAGAGTVREATYQGHRIVIRTTYTIEVDGQPLDAHFNVANNGRVHYHGIPNVDFRSAVDLVKRIIDAFPDDFAPGAPAGGAIDGPGRGHGGHGGHGGGHGPGR